MGGQGGGKERQLPEESNGGKMSSLFDLFVQTTRPQNSHLSPTPPGPPYPVTPKLAAHRPLCFPAHIIKLEAKRLCKDFSVYARAGASVTRKLCPIQHTLLRELVEYSLHRPVLLLVTWHGVGASRTYGTYSSSCERPNQIK